jgi:8-oxo-dGTP diphosphatase
MIDYVAEWVSGEPVAADDAVDAEFVSMDEAISRLSWDVTRRAVREAAEKRRTFLPMS